ILDAGVERDVTTKCVTSAQIEFLIGGSEIAIGEQQSASEESIGEERAVVAAAHHVAREGGDEFSGIVEKTKAPGVRSGAEWAGTFKRRERSDRNIGKRGIECGITEGFGHKGVKIRVVCLEP